MSTTATHPRFYRTDVHQIVGLTYRMVDYYNRTGQWRTEEMHTGSGSRPTVSYEEMVDLAVLAAVTPFLGRGRESKVPGPDLIRGVASEGGTWVVDAHGSWRRLADTGLPTAGLIVDVDAVIAQLRTLVDEWVADGRRLAVR